MARTASAAKSKKAREQTATTCRQCGKALKEERAVLDKEKNLIFCSEEHLYRYFGPQIEALQKEYVDRADDKELPLSEDVLSLTLDEPEEIWEDTSTFSEAPLRTFIRHFGYGEDSLYHYVAITYRTDGAPRLVLCHFPTDSEAVLNHFRRETKVYDKSYAGAGTRTLGGDALAEGDPLARGLFDAMMKVRSPKDIPEVDFEKYLEFRDHAIEEADEIWKSTNIQDNVIVTFVKEISSEGEDLYYIAVTVEDSASQSHYLLFSFPTNDPSLVDRYRQGENLEVEEVISEEGH